MKIFSVTLRTLPILTALLWVVGCSSSDGSEQEVECDSGTERTIACGLKGIGEQSQLCVDFQWTDDGACDDPTECLGSETRTGTASCGLNDRGVVREQCDDGVWAVVDMIETHACASNENPEQCACDDPDTCLDDDVGTEACGFEDSGTRPILCVEGTWAADGDCEGGYECNAPDDKNETNACGLNSRGTQFYECNDAGLFVPTVCEDPDNCVDDSVMEVECTDSVGDNNLPQVKDFECRDGQWVEGECRDSDRCTIGETEVVTCGVTLNFSGRAKRVCTDDGVGDGFGTWESSACLQQARAIYPTPYGVLLRTDGQIQLTVGDNQHRTAGSSDLADSSYLFPVPTPTPNPEGRYERFSASTSHQCSVAPTGYLFCWGDNRHGQLGRGGSQVPPEVAASVPALGDDVRAVAVGEGFSCALAGAEGDEVYCWGRNDSHQLGRNVETSSSEVPQKIMDGVRAIAAGDNHACAVTGNDVYCWGANDGRQAAASGDDEIAFPTRYDALSNDPGRAQAPPKDGGCPIEVTQSTISSIDAGRAHTLVSWKTTWKRSSLGFIGIGCGGNATYEDNLNVVGVGENDNGQIAPVAGGASGPANLVMSEKRLQPNSTTRLIARAMGNASCVLRMQNAEIQDVRCTGDNAQKQLSDASEDLQTMTSIPADLLGEDGTDERVADIAMGVESLCVLLVETRRIRCRGGNTYGQLGDGTTDSRDKSDFMLHELMDE